MLSELEILALRAGECQLGSQDIGQTCSGDKGF